MSKVVRIPSQAKPTADALVQFCVRAGVDYEFLPLSGGGHPTIRIEYGRQTRKMTFAATPSDRRRGALNAVSQARRLCREMGWEKPKKEKAMRMGKQGMSKFDGQRQSLGPASAGKVTRIRSKIEIPRPREGQLDLHHTQWAPEDSRRAKDRNLAMLLAKESGAKDSEIHDAVLAAGWTMAASSVSSQITHAKRERGDPIRPWKKQAKVQAQQPTPTTHLSELEELALEIAQAIAPVIARRMRTSNEALAKAEKWDAIKGLVSDA